MDRNLPVFFPEDTYDTPEDTPRYVLDRLLGTRWNLYLRYFGVVFRAWYTAVRNRYDDTEWATSSFAIFRQVERCGGRLHLSGIDNLRKTQGPVVIIGNHMSAAETQLLPSIIAPVRPVTFVVKRSLVTHPIFGPVMRSRDPIVVTRKDPRGDMEAVLTRGRELLARGVSVIVFPQATRRIAFVPEQFNSLGIKLARAGGVAVIPAAVKTDAWGNGRILRDFGPFDRTKPLHMAFGPPMPITGTGKSEHQAVIEFIRSRLQAWGAFS
ncbi:MAG: 1-acyl-sn-glycerol-3-phosphate acyltransferase [Candidatus Eisenbacteria bacterium]|jgi:1-acyl-sn-glycerol-3-phosphate acyltransferase|nr:1-acyl-sn-glycerol-3-phosphate acyltransferase [Candidatus Eisenbacteria bacterium]